MHRDDDSEIPRDDETLKELQQLPREIAPPSGAERRIAAALRDRGLLVPHRWRAPVSRKAAAVLGLLLLGFAGGWFLRPVADRAQSHVDAPPQFMLLLYGATDHNPAVDDSVAEYASWGRTLAQSGVRVTGEKLADEPGQTVGAAGADVSDAALRGFFIVQARDEPHARALAASHPHVKHGGIIVVRRIDPT